MSDLQSLGAYPVANRPAIEEITVTAPKPDDEGFSFWDFLDVINPLQHIPVVNTIYREVTGDEIKAPAKLIGSAILGGPVGLAAAMVDTAIEDGTGKDLGGHAMAFFRGEASGADEAVTATAVASAASGQSTTTASAKAIESRTDELKFMPIDPLRRQSAGQQRNSNAALAMAAIRSHSPNVPPGMMGQSGGKQLDSLLEATKPQSDTGLMPAADPFAAARRIMEDGGAVAVPAWFDKAMMDATSKYRAMQSVGES